MFLFFTFIVCTIYFSIILSLAFGWEKIKIYRKVKSSPSGFFISLIVPFRNEEKNIPPLINSLSNQSLDQNHFEILLIDDNSTDNSWNIARQEISGRQNIRCLKLNNVSGKKNAIKYGIENSEGELIVTTDADCWHHKEWLKTIHGFYNEKRPKLLIGPVIMKGENVFEKIQSLDFFSLVASGAGACGLNHPIMCNGANLAFEKEVFSDLQDPLNQNFESGDDVFLMHKIKKAFPGKVLFIKSENAMVYTKAEKTIYNFLEQRMRWASKSKGYKDMDTIITAIAVLAMNCLLLGTFITAFAKAELIYLFAFQLITKSIADFILLQKVATFYKAKKLLYYFIPTQLLNILLIPLIAISGFKPKINWKN